MPVFRKLKSDLSGALMGVGAVCGVLIDDLLLDYIHQKGSEFHKDPSRYGGIRGGLSTGEVITLKVFFKPTSSIGQVAVKGRHDPCIIPRAIPVLESMVELVIADHVLAKQLDHCSP